MSGAEWKAAHCKYVIQLGPRTPLLLFWDHNSPKNMLQGKKPLPHQKLLAKSAEKCFPKAMIPFMKNHSFTPIFIENLLRAKYCAKG